MSNQVYNTSSEIFDAMSTYTSFSRTMEDVDSDLLVIELGIVLKSEQKEAAESFLDRKDVFCVLPTGFGKSLIYQLFVLAKNKSDQGIQNGQQSLSSVR